MVLIKHQLARDGFLAPLKTARSRRQIEITGGLAAELRLAGGERIFDMTYPAAQYRWRELIKRLHGRKPVIHDLRHTHASRLIAAGWDPSEVAKRLADRVETVLRVYAHDGDERRRGQERRAMLEALYGQDGPKMAPDTPAQPANPVLNIADFADKRAQKKPASSG